jgi:hypothetical protein
MLARCEIVAYLKFAIDKEKAAAFLLVNLLAAFLSLSCVVQKPLGLSRFSVCVLYSLFYLTMMFQLQRLLTAE